MRNSPTPNRRAPSLEVTDRMTAKALVAPAIHLLAHWNERSVHLLVLGERAQGRPMETFSREAEVLASEVEAEKSRLEEALTILPEAVRRSNFVEDTERGLSDVVSRLNRARQLLAP